MLNRETDYYEEVIKRFMANIREHLPSSWRVIGLHNQMAQCSDLNAMMKQLEIAFSIKLEDTYFPRLKVDALIASCDPQSRIRLLLIEVKYGNPLKLIDYSQLIGYLQISKFCLGGALVLVADEDIETVSLDFLKVIELRQVSFSWKLTLPPEQKGFEFQTGIFLCEVGNGTHLMDTRANFGISDWPTLVQLLVSSDRYLTASGDKL